MFKCKCISTTDHIDRRNMWPLTLLSPYGVVLPVVSTLAFCFVSFNVVKWIVGDSSVIITNVNNRHSWKSIRITAKAWYCSICESLLMSGFGVYCDCCGVCADQDCVKRADRKLACKSQVHVPASQKQKQKQKQMAHQWVKGNLPLGALCYMCNEDCSMEAGLVDYQCCWCQRTVHTVCLPPENNLCDLGPYRKLIIPPWCVEAHRKKGSVRKKLQVKAVSDPDWIEWTPLIVVGNCKSGNGDGGLVLSEFRRLLNPAQVYDLSERSADCALQWCHLVKGRQTLLLVAGGDGTVAWMMNTMHRMRLTKQQRQPAVAIVPLGTGNDMSRVLGWGYDFFNSMSMTSSSLSSSSSSSPEYCIHLLIERIMKADSRLFDRWHVDIVPREMFGMRVRMPMPVPVKHMYMYNYLSVGVDAQVALDFHRTRESRLYLFSNRIFNKLLYLCFGTHQVVAAECRNLERRLELYLDGQKMHLPEIEAVVVLNISSWGAGVNLWGMLTNGIDDKQSYNDGKLEVVAIYSSFHMAQLQVGLATPYRVGQASNVQIKLLSSSPVQIDGEPWEQHPSSLNITVAEQATVLVNNE